MPEGAVRLEMEKSLWNVMQLYTLVNPSQNSCLKILIMHDGKFFVLLLKIEFLASIMVGVLKSYEMFNSEEI